MLKQIITYIPGTVLPLILSVLAAALFTRIFSAEEYGRFSLAISITALATTLSFQWLQQSINRYLPSEKSIEGRKEIKEIIVGSLFLILVSQLCLSGIILFFLLDSSFIHLAIASVLLIISMSLFVPLTVIFQAEMHAKRYTVYNLINASLKFLLGAGIVFFFYRKAGGLVLGYAFSYLILIPILWRSTELPSFLNIFDFQKLKSILFGVKRFARYGIPMIGWFFASNILSVGDRYLIQFFRGSSEVGIYSANYSLIAGSISLITLPVQLAAHPFLMKAWSNDDRDETRKWLGLMIEWSITLGFILVGCIWLMSRDIAFLFLGPEFREGHKIMPVVVFGIIFWQLGTYAHKPLEFAEKTKLMMYCCLVSAALNIILNIIFLPKLGYVAAAYTTVISYLFYNLLVTIAGLKIVHWKVNIQILARNFILTMFGISVIWFLRQMLETRTTYLISVLFSILGCMTLVAFIIYQNKLHLLFRRINFMKVS